MHTQYFTITEIRVSNFTIKDLISYLEYELNAISNKLNADINSNKINSICEITNHTSKSIKEINTNHLNFISEILYRTSGNLRQMSDILTDISNIQNEVHKKLLEAERLVLVKCASKLGISFDESIAIDSLIAEIENIIESNRRHKHLTNYSSMNFSPGDTESKKDQLYELNISLVDFINLFILAITNPIIKTEKINNLFTSLAIDDLKSRKNIELLKTPYKAFGLILSLLSFIPQVRVRA